MCELMVFISVSFSVSVWCHSSSDMLHVPLIEFYVIASVQETSVLVLAQISCNIDVLAVSGIARNSHGKCMIKILDSLSMNFCLFMGLLFVCERKGLTT